jgi:hypothetical protein
MGSDESALLRRVLEQAGDTGLLDVLADRLSGTDLTSLLLEVMRRRAERTSAADVMRQYLTDRFVSPAPGDFRALRRVEDLMLAAMPPDFELLTLAPVLPLAAHCAMAGVDPRNMIATIRRTEVAADPTNGLALEAAVRRRGLLSAAPRSAEAVRLAATQRVTRAQLFDGPASFAHFQLLAAVTSGRDTGDRAFERRHLIEHLRFAVRGLAAAGASEITIAVTCLEDAAAGILRVVEDEFADAPGVRVADAPERESGRAYYQFLCFKIFVKFPDSPGSLEISDGGFTDWTAQLLGNRKERLLISGHGLDRLAILASYTDKRPVPPGPTASLAP